MNLEKIVLVGNIIIINIMCKWHYSGATDVRPVGMCLPASVTTSRGVYLIKRGMERKS